MDARTYVEAHASGFFADLKEWLAIPSISADPAHRDEVRKSAGWLAAVRAGRRAMERAFGREILFTGEGGSGPEADLAEILGAPLGFLAVGLDSDRIHAPNEKVEMGLLLKGAEAAAYLWGELASAGLTSGAGPRP